MMHASFRDGSREDVTYAVITELLLQYKHPVERFVLYPQLSLRWKPDDLKDTRAEIPDIGVGNFSLQAPCFKMRLGIEAKRLVGSDCQGFLNPQGSGVGSVGVRVGDDISIPLTNPYPQSGVRGIDKDKNLCKLYIYFSLKLFISN
jgi:hypothetical protein